ncbi:hypothetical protein BCR41DRAFT_370709 [Lobosporangium transversale]|uniref:Uncharacterized protein n=1 Tax=Lobosporangium transversale TaxID=64571 RepID=A0A1Y2GMV2_9FUNG|nr:hypothetical protein BCR41DRAFT_370709 [Lobosporangium transversale]ORZ16121.1 hypothetical protein BCR41DRAFT_370709 [Lobosporangium transversale]|eukprot:XP_021881468.1 hypothetical protein BCR41DRAFT_370709 [Lobosporangium transversale]
MDGEPSLKAKILSICPPFEKLDCVYSSSLSLNSPRPIQSTDFTDPSIFDSNDDDDDDDSIVEIDSEDNVKLPTVSSTASINARRMTKRRKIAIETTSAESMLVMLQKARNAVEKDIIESKEWANERKSIVSNRESAVCHREHVLFSKEVDLYSKHKEMDKKKKIDEDDYDRRKREKDDTIDELRVKHAIEMEQVKEKLEKEKQQIKDKFEKEIQEIMERFEKERQGFIAEKQQIKEELEKDRQKVKEEYEQEKKERKAAEEKYIPLLCENAVLKRELEFAKQGTK